MENSRVPIEVCEHVIDECFYLDRWGDFQVSETRGTLSACALTCSAWLPRSQYKLYQEICLSEHNTAQILDTFTARPELAGYVRAIDIDLEEYAPLTQVLSLSLLKKCHRLRIGIYWRCFPPRYVQNCLVPLLTNFGSVVELNFQARSAASAIDFFHIIWAMPQLLWCRFYDVGTFTLAASSLDHLRKTALKIKPRLRLNTLILDPEPGNLPHIQDYPPQGAFGSLVNLTRFEFGFTTAAAVSDSFLQFLGEMVSLEELKITVFFEDYKPGVADPLAQVLREMQSLHLEKCDIDFWTDDYQYGCKRGDLIEIISSQAMQRWLQHLPSIPEFTITVRDNDAAFNKDWWTTEITKNLPALKDTLTVHVHLFDGVEWYKNLWIEDLPAEAASSINTETNMHINSELDELSAVSEDPYPGIDGSNHEDNTVTEAVSAFQVIE